MDVVDRNAYVLRVKDIFGNFLSVTAWTKEREDSQTLGLQSPEERLMLCEVIMKEFGRQILKELLGVRSRHWGAAELGSCGGRR